MTEKRVSNASAFSDVTAKDRTSSNVSNSENEKPLAEHRLSNASSVGHSVSQKRMSATMSAARSDGSVFDLSPHRGSMQSVHDLSSHRGSVQTVAPQKSTVSPKRSTASSRGKEVTGQRLSNASAMSQKLSDAASVVAPVASEKVVAAVSSPNSGPSKDEPVTPTKSRTASNMSQGTPEKARTSSNLSQGTSEKKVSIKPVRSQRSSNTPQKPALDQSRPSTGSISAQQVVMAHSTRSNRVSVPSNALPQQDVTAPPELKKAISFDEHQPESQDAVPKRSVVGAANNAVKSSVVGSGRGLDMYWNLKDEDVRYTFPVRAPTNTTSTGVQVQAGVPCGVPSELGSPSRVGSLGGSVSAKAILPTRLFHVPEAGIRGARLATGVAIATISPGEDNKVSQKRPQQMPSGAAGTTSPIAKSFVVPTKGVLGEKPASSGVAGEQRSLGQLLLGANGEVYSHVAVESPLAAQPRQRSLTCENEWTLSSMEDKGLRTFEERHPSREANAQPMSARQPTRDMTAGLEWKAKYYEDLKAPHTARLNRQQTAPGRIGFQRSYANTCAAPAGVLPGTELVPLLETVVVTQATTKWVAAETVKDVSAAGANARNITEREIFARYDCAPQSAEAVGRAFSPSVEWRGRREGNLAGTSLSPRDAPPSERDVSPRKARSPSPNLASSQSLEACRFGNMVAPRAVLSGVPLVGGYTRQPTPSSLNKEACRYGGGHLTRGAAACLRPSPRV